MRDEHLTLIAKPREALRARLSGIAPDARLTALATFAFLGVAFWWLTQETRTPDFDSAMHTLYGRRPEIYGHT